MKISKKIIALVLSVVMLSTTFIVAANAVNTNDVIPSIIVPGLFQSETKYYEDGKATDLEAPFFMSDTTEIVGAALTEVLVPITKLLITQQDKDQQAAKALSGVLGDVLMGKLKSDENGKFIKDIRATKYYDSFKDLSDYDKDFILDQLPLNKYIELAGEENLYVFSYASLGNMKATAQELYDFIQFVKEDSGSDKVNLAPVSQGGSVMNAVMQLYKDNGRAFSEDINRIVYVIPALDGSILVGEIYQNGLLDDDDALYSKMLPALMGVDEMAGYLVNIVLRIMPNADLNAILDTVAFDLVNDYMKYSTLMWGLVPSGNYEACRDMYLNDEASAVIREEADWYYNAQCNSDAYISEAKAQGVEIFDIVDYNISLYEIVDSWDDVNADGIIQLDSTSMGAYSVGVGKKLPADYVRTHNNCTNPNHDHSDPRKIVDANTGLLPCTTFYFYNQDHEKTGSNDVIMKLVSELLVDENFKDVYSYPDRFPQFNVGRNSKGLMNDLEEAKQMDTSNLSVDQFARYQHAISRAEEALEQTNVDLVEFEAAKAYFYDTIDEVIYGEEKEYTGGLEFNDFLTTIFRIISDLLYYFFGGAGFNDM
ncbi:MAG: hypothetical protein E7557_03875 [Ruminococcaceae bacterium]|nr:hypothetical protein [Oscillospiraceae bacterium]